ncbi:MAG: alpha/beta fold hydrolase [Chitinophagales bacterium]
MEKEISIAGKKIFYRVYGNGKPVMLVHGFGETGDVWKNQAGPPQTPPKEGLKNSFMFIVPDLPGSGQSDLIDDMSIEGMAEVLKHILDKELSELSESSEVPPSGGFRGAELSDLSESSKAPSFGGGLGEVSLIGHSMGGYITLAFAEKYEALLRSFGLLHSTAFADSEEKKAVRRKGIAFIREHGAFEFLKTSTPNLFSPQTKEQSPELVSQFIQSLSNFSAGSLISYYESMIKRPDRTGVLKHTKLPVLFIMGEYDNAVPLEDGLKLCQMPEKAYIHVLHQSGHMGMLEEPGKTSQMLEEFLSEA